MQYIYIENYLTIAQQQKQSFLKFINKSDDFKVSNQKIIFCEESLLIGFLEKSNISKAYMSFKDFFKEFNEIKIDIITKIITKPNHTVLAFLNNNKQLRIS
jgi:hypothetical protein